MSAVYDLFDLDDGNIVGSYETEGDALAVVRAARRDHGETVATALSMIRIDEDGTETLVADGVELVRLAESRAARSSVRHVA